MPDGAVPREVVALRLLVNGEERRLDVPARRLLVDVLRDDLDLTGTHVGCEQGVCGACTVLVDGEPARSCTQLAVQLDGCAITTIEGLSEPGRLTPLQEAFERHHALQCGFCTPGFIVTLDGAPPEDLSDDGIRAALAGNLCRCTGYEHIVAAVRDAFGHGHEERDT